MSQILNAANALIESMTMPVDGNVPETRNRACKDTWMSQVQGNIFGVAANVIFGMASVLSDIFCPKVFNYPWEARALTEKNVIKLFWVQGKSL